MNSDTRLLYEQSAADWQRSEPVLLSDYTARQRVFELVGDIRGLHLWDLGCGEGYVSRRLAALGARQVDGFDLSAAMVDGAQRQASSLDASLACSLNYRVADLSDSEQLPHGSCDAAVAVFLFNYLSLSATQSILAHVYAAVRPGGFFLFTVPHPLLPFLRAQEPPFCFDSAGHPYLGSDNQIFEGRIWRRDGAVNSVRAHHKTLQDYFQMLSATGWQGLPHLEELGVTEAHLNLDPAFFGPLRGLPLHLLVLLRR